MIRPLTDRMAEVLRRVASGVEMTYSGSDMRTMRALERRALVRHLKRKDVWTLTAAGEKQVS